MAFGSGSIRCAPWMGCCVCFVSLVPQRTRDMPVIVTNPLIGDIHELSMDSLNMLPRMVQIALDTDKEWYQMIIVGDTSCRNMAVEVFHSGTRV